MDENNGRLVLEFYHRGFSNFPVTSNASFAYNFLVYFPNGKNGVSSGETTPGFHLLNGHPAQFDYTASLVPLNTANPGQTGFTLGNTTTWTNILSGKTTDVKFNGTSTTDGTRNTMSFRITFPATTGEGWMRIEMPNTYFIYNPTPLLYDR